MGIDSDRVNSIYEECAIKNVIITDHAIIVPCIIIRNIDNPYEKLLFYPNKIEKYEDIVHSYLTSLDKKFQTTGGSLLVANQNADGTRWGNFKSGEKLICLGLASGWASYTIREPVLWSTLPGGMPHFVVNSTRDAISVTEMIFDRCSNHKTKKPGDI